MPKRWYFIHTYANFENKVADPRVCEGRYLDYLFEEIIVPTENLLDVRHGQKHATERRFSPSCALAKMGLTDEAYHLIKNSQRSPASLAHTKSRTRVQSASIVLYGSSRPQAFTPAGGFSILCVPSFVA